MKNFANKTFCVVAAVSAFAAAMLVGQAPTLTGSGSMISQARAVIGRPLTPLSYAGVARRTTRRAVVAGAAIGAAAAPVVVVPACVLRYDTYGRPYHVCP